MLKKITTICLLIYISVFVAKTQNIDKNKIILVSKISEFIQADGFLNESIWLKIEPVGGFWEHFPSDSIRPEKNTEVKIAYDTEFLYIAAICYDRRVSPIVQSLTRDDNGGFWASDAFSFTIDPLNTQKSGYFFGLNTGGAEIDALVTQRGANPVFDNNWSSKWFSGVQVIDDGISYEFKIPLSIFNFDSNNKEWGINFMRNDTEDYNKFITWTQFPMMYDARDLNYLGRIEFESDINSSNDRFVLMPGISLKIDDDETPGLVKSKLKYGLDAKIKLSSTTNMDLMIIPDFSNANVDKDYIDFNRYEYFMNEQRTFFLENGDLFFDYGDSDFRPIYTRRIGIHNWNDYTIWAGGRVTGKLIKGFDFGILSIQTDAYEELPSQNFSIAAVRKNYKSLDVKLLATTVEDFENKKHIDSAYNRNIGTAITYSLFDGKMNLQAGLNKSFVDKKYDDSFYFNGGINVNTKHWKLDNTINSVQDNYLNSLGFFNRMFHEDHQKDTTYRHGLTQILNRYRYWIYPKESKIFNYYFPQVFHKSSFDFKSNLLEFVFGVEMQANHKNSSYSTVFLFYDKINTLYPLRVFSDNPQFSLLPAGFYDYNTIGMYHKTDARKKLQYEIFTKYGGFYNGNQYELWNALNLRLQPILKLRLEYTFRDIKLPDNYGQGTYHLWGLQTDIFFSKNVILTNFFQYNTQSDRVRLNSRIQWIYSPMSSLYFVISEAFQPEAKYHKKLAITLKLTYWLGL